MDFLVISAYILLLYKYFDFGVMLLTLISEIVADIIKAAIPHNENCWLDLVAFDYCHRTRTRIY